jgi:hypothetical protein
MVGKSVPGWAFVTELSIRYTVSNPLRIDRVAVVYKPSASTILREKLYAEKEVIRR